MKKQQKKHAFKVLIHCSRGRLVQALLDFCHGSHRIRIHHLVQVDWACWPSHLHTETQTETCNQKYKKLKAKITAPRAPRTSVGVHLARLQNVLVLHMLIEYAYEENIQGWVLLAIASTNSYSTE